MQTCFDFICSQPPRDCRFTRCSRYTNNFRSVSLFSFLYATFALLSVHFSHYANGTKTQETEENYMVIEFPLNLYTRLKFVLVHDQQIEIYVNELDCFHFVIKTARVCVCVFLHNYTNVHSNTHFTFRLFLSIVCYLNVQYV